MREINNNTTNTGNVNFSRMQPVKEELPAETPSAETVEVTDLSKMPSEVIGRSQVAKTALAKDTEFFANNPEQVSALLKFCEDLQNKGFSYEEACAIMSETANEVFKA